MTTAPVLLYVRTGCSYCEAKRTELAARGVAVREINLSERPQATAELMKLTGGRRIVPVVVDGTRIEVAPDGGSSF
jgi:glutaredoxin